MLRTGTQLRGGKIVACWNQRDDDEMQVGDSVVLVGSVKEDG